MTDFYSIRDTLSFAIRLEQASQDFYHHLSQIIDSPSVARFLQTLINEESIHEHQLRQLLMEVDAISEPLITSKEIDGYVQAMQIPKSLDYKEAVKLAMDKEKAAQSLYTIIAGTTNNDLLKEAFRQLALQEKNHHDYFKKEYQKICLGEN